jgi:ferric-dicitrate binding protein FerR (iron transport regulator)
MNEQIEKYFLGELLAEQKEELFKHIAGNQEERDEFAQVQNSWALAVASGAVNDRNKAQCYLKEFKMRQNRKKMLAFFTGLSKYAAILVVGVLIAWGILYKPQVEEKPAMAYQTLTVPAGQRAHLTLADGTSVWVNAKSTLKYPGVFTGDTRELTLTGEAYFEVAENKAQPFIVKSGNFCTQVTGTQFNVFAYDGFFNVSLVEGQVKVYEAGTAKDVIILNPNERVVLIGGQLVKKSLINTDDFLWKEGLYCFDNVSFSAIVEKLQLYFDVQIHVTNKTLQSHKFTGKFRQRDGIETVLKALQKTHPFVFSISKDGSNIYIM